MSIRRKRRQRGKRKSRRREALLTWELLSRQAQPPKETDTYPGIILPIIRQYMPAMIANELVGVQPMALPAGDFPSMDVRYFYYDRTKKEIQKQRKKERAAKKRERTDVEKALRTKRKEAKCND